MTHLDPPFPQTPASSHPGGNPGANLKSISHRCHPILVEFVWKLTKETIDLPLGCLQGGLGSDRAQRIASPAAAHVGSDGGGRASAHEDTLCLR